MRHLAREVDGKRGRAYFYGPFLSAAIAARDEASMRSIMGTALEDGITTKTIDEIILQTHLFLGFPAMIEASRVFARVRDRRRNTDCLPSAYTGADCRAWHRDGLKKIRRIYGPAFDRLVRYINSFSPQILTWMINDGYGQVLSRPGAPFQLREICVVAMLTVTSYENQLRAHIRGTLNSGVEAALVERAIGWCRYFCSEEYIRKAMNILREAAAT